MSIFKSIKNYFNDTNYLKRLSIIAGGIFSIFLIMSISLSLSALTPVKSIIIKSKILILILRNRGLGR